MTANNFGSNYDFTVYDPANVLNGATLTTANNGANATCTVSVTTTTGVVTVPFTGGQGTQASGLDLTDSNGNSLILTQAGNFNLTANPTQVGVLGGNTVQFQVGANSNQSVQYAMPSIAASVLGPRGSGKDPCERRRDDPERGVGRDGDHPRSDQPGVTDALRSRLVPGKPPAAYISGARRAQENLSASASQIRDTDFAQEMTVYTQLQLLSQSGVAVLAQANKDPQTVLQLLQG